jgi:hypothetical protein
METAKPDTPNVKLDLAGSLIVQMSSDLKLLKRLHFFNYMLHMGKELGHVTRDSARAAQLGFVKLKETKGFSPVVKSWGPLTGLYVSPNLKRMLDAYVALDTYRPPSFPVIGEGLAWINRVWKNFRLGLAFRSCQFAFAGNVIISAAKGYDPLDVLNHAAVGLAAKDRVSKALRREAEKFGILQTGLAYETFDREMLELRKILKTDEGKLEALGWKIYGISQYVIQRGLKGFSFGNIDALWKFGLYRKLRLEGVKAEEAAKIAAYSFGYYQDLPVIARSIRDTIMPFISFTR